MIPWLSTFFLWSFLLRIFKIESIKITSKKMRWKIWSSIYGLKIGHSDNLKHLQLNFTQLYHGYIYIYIYIYILKSIFNFFRI